MRLCSATPRSSSATCSVRRLTSYVPMAWTTQREVRSTGCPTGPDVLRHWCPPPRDVRAAGARDGGRAHGGARPPLGAALLVRGPALASRGLRRRRRTDLAVGPSPVDGDPARRSRP